MVSKTVDLDLDAYERLEKARFPGESLSEVVRRALWPGSPITAAELLIHLKKRGPLFSEAELDEIDRAAAADKPPVDPWG
jgi:hypothetical protein